MTVPSDDDPDQPTTANVPGEASEPSERQDPVPVESTTRNARPVPGAPSNENPFGTTVTGVVPTQPGREHGPEHETAAVAATGHAATGPQPSPSNAPSSPSNAPSGPHRASELAPRRRRRWVWPVVAAGALVIGVGIGATGGGDPTTSDEYQALAAERDELRDAVDAAEDRADQAEEAANATIDALGERGAELDDREAALDDRAADLDGREVDLDDREAAVAGAEAAVAATQIGIGTWTVGVDVEPGTYRTAEAVTSSCYWGIYRSGTNKADIIDNDIVQGGFPTVTLSAGQDFENGCGVWNKQ